MGVFKSIKKLSSKLRLKHKLTGIGSWDFPPAATASTPTDIPRAAADDGDDRRRPGAGMRELRLTVHDVRGLRIQRMPATLADVLVDMDVRLAQLNIAAPDLYGMVGSLSEFVGVAGKRIERLTDDQCLMTRIRPGEVGAVTEIVLDPETDAGRRTEEPKVTETVT